MSVIAAMWSQSMPWRMPEQETGQQDAEVDGGRGDGGGGADEVEHAMGLPRGWLKSVIHAGRYRNGLQLSAIATRIYAFVRCARPGSPATAPDAPWARCPGSSAGARPALDAAAPDPDRGPLRTDGHVTGAELVERCREIDPGTIPSTVYRTLDVLEELGLLSHSHAADGREEFHVLPAAVHGHLHCIGCHTTWEIEADEAAGLVESMEQRRGFAVDVTHLSIAGRCANCTASLETVASKEAGDAWAS